MIKHLLVPALASLLCLQTAVADQLSDVIAGDHRSEANSARDVYRNPAATLEFFDVQPNHTVVEISPGGGWYTEILAPYLRADGLLYAAHFPVDTEVAYYVRALSAFQKKIEDKPVVYDKVQVTEFGPGAGVPMAPPNSADRVVTFRNVHNWLGNDFAAEAFAGFYTALKPGGVLGVVEHRAAPGTSAEDMQSSGYVTEATVIALAEEAGFEFVGRSDINANPDDSKDHPRGVWTLPPSLALGDQDREKYLAIGESDRMTLKFRKPTAQ